MQHNTAGRVTAGRIAERVCYHVAARNIYVGIKSHYTAADMIAAACGVRIFADHAAGHVKIRLYSSRSV